MKALSQWPRIIDFGQLLVVQLSLSQSNVCDQARKNSNIEIEFGTDIKERLTARAAESSTDPATLPRKRERAQYVVPLTERMLLEDRKQSSKH